MSVIVASSTYCCPGGTIITPTTQYCVPAVAINTMVPVGETLSIDSVDIAHWRAAK